jgi:hypothetical protein
LGLTSGCDEGALDSFSVTGSAGNVLGLTSLEVAQLALLSLGEGLWRVNERAFVVGHICTPDELTLFDTDDGPDDPVREPRCK